MVKLTEKPGGKKSPTPIPPPIPRPGEEHPSGPPKGTGAGWPPKR